MVALSWICHLGRQRQPIHGRVREDLPGDREHRPVHAGRDEVARHHARGAAHAAGRVHAQHRLAAAGQRIGEEELRHHDALEHVGRLAEHDRADPSLRRRPAGPHPHPGVGRGRGAPARGRGAGVAAAAGLSIRGAAPAAAEGAEGAPAEGVAIAGAGKRAREEGEASGDDSLAKRLKPEGAGAGRPVPIQRNRVHTPAPGP